MNIFEYAIRNKLRFTTNKGQIDVEQLFAVPLRSRDGFDLDAIAKVINTTLKATVEESFVAKPKSTTKYLEVMLEIVKAVIAEKLEAEEDAKNKVLRDQERARLKSALLDKQEDAIKSLSAEEIQKRLAELEE